MPRLLRSPREYWFRLKQEAVNLFLLASPPKARPLKPRLEFLPDPAPIVAHLRGSEFARDLTGIANEILHHRFPVLGLALETGSDIHWRKDYQRNIETGTEYFRKIPYLDVSRAGDHKLIWELNRHQHLVLLAQAFLFSNDERYLNEILAQLESWRAQNPFQRGINWTSALEVAFRALSWVWLHHLIADRLPQWFAESLYQHGCHLEINLSRYFSPNTHLLGEALALDVLGRAFEKQDWQRTGTAVLREQSQRQVRPDGGYFEQSSYYHVYALDMFQFHAIISGDLAYWRPLLEKMADYLQALLGPSRRLPLIGDDDGGRFFHPYGRCDEFARATLATSKVLLRQQWSNDTSEQTVWWLPQPLLHAVSEPRPSGGGSRLFRNTGIAILQSGPLQVIVDAGPFGPGPAGHSHSDTLSIIVRNGDEDILIDPGTFTYMGEERNWFRGSIAHNTVRIDGRDQAVPVNPFRWAETPLVEVRAATEDFLDAECRYGNFIHRRRILLIKQEGIILIVDDVSGNSVRKHEVEQLWHPAVTPEPTAPNIFHLGASTLVLAGGISETKPSWRSTAFGTRQEATLIQHKIQSPLPVRLCAALIPGGSIETLTADAEFIWTPSKGAPQRYAMPE